MLSAFKRYANYDKLLLNSRKRVLEIDFAVEAQSRHDAINDSVVAGWEEEEGAAGGGAGRPYSCRRAAQLIK